MNKFSLRLDALVVGILVLLTGAVIPSSREPDLRHLPRPEVKLPPRPWVALTFDDGPHPGHTQALLDLLRRERVTATFFVVGKMVERHPGLVRSIYQDGHEIANHTFNHYRLSTLNNRDILSELETTQEAVYRITGQRSMLYRPPGGDFSRRTARVASQAGYHMVLWSVATKDVQGMNAAYIRRKIIEGARDGGIVLMHSGMPATVEALPEAIQRLRDRGYHFVNVSQLLGMEKPETVPVPAPADDRAAVQTVRLTDSSRFLLHP